MIKKLFTAVLALMAFCNVVGAASHTTTFTRTDFTQKGQTCTYDGDVSWTNNGTWKAFDTLGAFFGWSATKALQFGSTSNPCSEFSLTSGSFAGKTVTKVTVNSSTGNSAEATCTVSVGGKSFGTKTLTTDPTDYEFTGSASGDVVVSWAQTTERALYVKTITVEYEDAANGGEQQSETTVYDSGAFGTVEAVWNVQGTKAINGVDWTLSAELKEGATQQYFARNSSKGQQFGSANNPYTTVNISTDAFAKAVKITKVEVNSSTATGSDAVLSVAVGDKSFGTQTLTTSAADYVFEGDAAGGNVVLTWTQTPENAKALYVKSIKVTYEKAAASVAKPVITLSSDATTHFAPVTVTINCETEGADIHYTLDGTTPTDASTLYAEPFTVSENATVKAIAFKGGESSEVSDAATLTFGLGLANLAEFNALGSKEGFDKNTLVSVANDVTAIYHNRKYLYVKDNSGYALLFDTNNKYTETTINNGDVIPGGFFGKYAEFNMLPEMAYLDGVGELKAGTAVEPVEATVADITAANVNKYVKLSNVKLTAPVAKTFEMTDETGTVSCYNQFTVDMASLDPEKTYDVEGFVSISYDPQFYPTSITEYVAPAPSMWWGNYSNQQTSLTGNYKLGTYEVAMFVAGDGDLKGVNIAGERMQTRLYSNAKDVKIWVRKTLDGENIAEKVVENPASSGWSEAMFDAPVALPEEGAYVGYSFTLASWYSDYDYTPIVRGSKVVAGGFYLKQPDETTFSDKSATGCSTSQILISGGDLKTNVASIADDIDDIVALKGSTIKVNATVTSQGTAGISSLDYTYTLDGSSHDGHIDLETPFGQMFGEQKTFEIELGAPTQLGTQESVIQITKVNGEANENVSVKKTKASVNITVLAESAPRTAVAEIYVGPSKPYSARGLVGAEQLAKTMGDKVIPVVVQSYDSPLVTPEYKAYQQYADGSLRFTSYPTAEINREFKTDPYFGNSTAAPYHFTANTLVEPTLDAVTEGSVSAQASWADDAKTTVKISAKANFTGDFSDASYRFGFMVIADSIKQDFSNYITYYKTQYPDDDMAFWRESPYSSKDIAVNNMVVASTDVTGISKSIPSTIAAGTDYTYELELPINQFEGQNPQNFRVVALLLNNDKKIVVNAALASLEETTPEEEGTAIFKWANVTGADDYVAEAGTIECLGGDKNDRLNYANAALGVNYKTICLNGKKGNLGDGTTNGTYMKVTPTQALKAGDVIAMTAYRNKDAMGKKASAALVFSNGASAVIGADPEFPNLNAAGENPTGAPETIELVVTEEMAGAKSINLTRQDVSTNLFITSLIITSESIDEVVPVESVSIVDPDNTVLDNATYTLKQGETLQLTAVINPENATNQNVSWEVMQDTEVITFEEGLVTAVGEGKAAVVVTTEDGEKQAFVYIYVPTPEPVKEPTTFEISNEGLDVTITPSNDNVYSYAILIPEVKELYAQEMGITDSETLFDLLASGMNITVSGATTFNVMEDYLEYIGLEELEPGTEIEVLVAEVKEGDDELVRDGEITTYTFTYEEEIPCGTYAEPIALEDGKTYGMNADVTGGQFNYYTFESAEDVKITLTTTPGTNPGGGFGVSTGNFMFDDQGNDFADAVILGEDDLTTEMLPVGDGIGNEGGEDDFGVGFGNFIISSYWNAKAGVKYYIMCQGVGTFTVALSEADTTEKVGTMTNPINLNETPTWTWGVDGKVPGSATYYTYTAEKDGELTISNSNEDIYVGEGGWYDPFVNTGGPAYTGEIKKVTDWTAYTADHTFAVEEGVTYCITIFELTKGNDGEVIKAEFTEATGIKGAAANKANGNVYNVRGQKVDGSTFRGIMIKNGVKVIKK
ncbi:MAG: chitobiase/beta-hexosaminidase C-terminal domain-containing protein [Bacteroidaceae bacterium]|nr:chitobiase/beta-hexosaminidase C-terminal domain-containing protein [Bacteroidaceae bacterium]